MKSKIKKLIKNNPITAKAGFFLRRSFYTLKMMKYSSAKVNDKGVLFNNFNGRGFGDNPKAIALKMHEYLPDYVLFWAYNSENDKSSLPAYITPVKYNSDEYFKVLSNSKFWIANVLLPAGTRKKRNQIYIQTWHGDKPLKKILKDAADDSDKYKNTSAGIEFEKECDYFVSGSRWFSRVWKRTAEFDGTVLEYGMPRNDCLVNCSSEESQMRIAEFRKLYGITGNQKVLLYAPTFRDHSLNDELFSTGLQLNDVIAELKNIYDSDWVCLIRGHGGKQLTLENQDNSLFIDVTDYPDMSDVMLSSDMLITDYSSCAGDFALLKRPVIMYQDDYKLYTSKDRSLYFKMEDSPYLVAHDTEELKDILNSSDSTIYQNVCESILEFYETVDDGQSSIKICELIESLNDKQKRVD